MQHFLDLNNDSSAEVTQFMVTKLSKNPWEMATSFVTAMSTASNYFWSIRVSKGENFFPLLRACATARPEVSRLDLRKFQSSKNEIIIELLIKNSTLYMIVCYPFLVMVLDISRNSC